MGFDRDADQHRWSCTHIYIVGASPAGMRRGVWRAASVRGPRSPTHREVLLNLESRTVRSDPRLGEIISLQSPQTRTGQGD